MRDALNNTRSASTRTELGCTVDDVDAAAAVESMEDMTPSSSPFFPGVAANAQRRVCKGFALGFGGGIDDAEACAEAVSEGFVADIEL